MESNQVIAVMTGDIVRSTQLPHAIYEDLLYTLHTVLTHICDNHHHNKFETSRGDSFQVVLHDPQHAAKYALLVRASLKAQHPHFDCRISIGLGYDTAIRHKISQSTGDAFTLSGRALDEMTVERLQMTSLNATFNQHFALLTKYVDLQLCQMTVRQCAIATLVISNQPPLTQGEIAETLGVNRVSVNRSMKRASIGLLLEYSELFNLKVEELIL